MTATFQYRRFDPSFLEESAGLQLFWTREHRICTKTILHPIAAPINGQDLCMMQKPIQQSCRQDLITEQISPGRKARIGRQQDRAMLITSSNQLEEVMRLPWCEPGVSYFINDKNTGSGVATESLTHQAGMRCGFKRLGQVRQSREQRGMSCCQCFDRERKAQVCFSPSIRMPS